MSDEISHFFGTMNQRLKDAMQAERREIERFFVELNPRLETLRTLESELDRQLAPRFNVFDYLRTDELGLSQMIGDLLDPVGRHGQGAAFLQCLTERLGFARDCDPSDSRVCCELTITGGRRIDIAVEIDGTHCLAIENKANDAGDQPGQMRDYLSWLEKNYREHLLVYLTPTGEGPSEDSVSGDTIETLGKETPRRLVIMPCGPGGELDDAFNDLRLSFSLADWLADCRRDCDGDRLRWFLREAETFCRRRYGGTIVPNAKSNVVKDFVLAHPENMETALAVYESWPAIEAQIKRNFLELLRELLRKELPEDTVLCSNYGEGEEASGSYICIHRKNWRPYRGRNGKEVVTRIWMQARSKRGTACHAGVKSISIDDVCEEDEKRRQRLQAALAKCGKQSGSWPWLDWITDKYGDWNALLPRLHQENQKGGGEITDYFVGRLNTVFERAAPVIEDIDGS